MLNSLNDAAQEMKKFIEEYNKAQVELRRERRPKLKELVERLDKKFLKEERDDEAIQEMRKFIEECDKAHEELDKEQGLKLMELTERLDNFRNMNKEDAPYRQEDVAKKVSEIKKAAKEVFG